MFVKRVLHGRCLVSIRPPYGETTRPARGPATRRAGRVAIATRWPYRDPAPCRRINSGRIVGRVPYLCSATRPMAGGAAPNVRGREQSSRSPRGSGAEPPNQIQDRGSSHCSSATPSGVGGSIAPKGQASWQRLHTTHSSGVTRTFRHVQREKMLRSAPYGQRKRQ